MSKTFTDQNWGGVLCTLDENGTLIINTEELKDVVIEVTNDDVYNNVTTPWNNNRTNIKSVIIKGHISFKKDSSLKGLFYNFQNCESFDGLKNLGTTNVNNMSSMFSNCYKLTSLDLSSFNTTNVQYIDVIFQICSSLTFIITPKEFDTNNKTITQFYNLCNNWYDIKGNQLTNQVDVRPKMIYYKNVSDIHKSLTKLDFSVNNRCYYKLDNNVLTIYPIIHPNIGYSLTELRTEIESNIPNITKVIIKGYN